MGARSSPRGASRCVEVTHRPRYLAAWPQGRENLHAWAAKPVTAFCGIGNPAGFRRTLQQCGFNVVGFLRISRTITPTAVQTSSGLACWSRNLAAESIVCTDRRSREDPSSATGGAAAAQSGHRDRGRGRCGGLRGTLDTILHRCAESLTRRGTAAQSVGSLSRPLPEWRSLPVAAVMPLAVFPTGLRAVQRICAGDAGLLGAASAFCGMRGECTKCAVRDGRLPVVMRLRVRLRNGLGRSALWGSLAANSAERRQSIGDPASKGVADEVQRATNW